MNRQQFLSYIAENFSINGEASRLIDNILIYSERLEYEDQYSFLCEMFDGTIGLSEAEIRKISL